MNHFRRSVKVNFPPFGIESCRTGRLSKKPPTLTMDQQNQPLLPKGFCVLETQVAGHLFSSNTAVLGMLKDDVQGCVLKPFGKPECGTRELSFYDTVNNATDPVLVRLQKFIPRFYTKIRLEVNAKEHTFFQLEDLTHNMQKPCIMDIKVGKRTWDPLASPHKCKVEEQKYARCKQVLGLCLPGFQVYTLEGEYKKFDRDYGKQLDADGLRQSIRQFLNAQDTVCQPLVQELLRQLYDIRQWFHEQRHFHFFASSLLIAYDFVALQKRLQQPEQLQHCLKCQLNNGGGGVGDNDEIIPNGNHNTRLNDVADLAKFPHLNNKDFGSVCTCLKNYVKVRLIDFAHVFPASNDSLDMNYLFGLESLLGILEDMLKR